VSVALNYVVDGPADGPIVVFSGSLGSDLRMWEPQVAPLVAAGYRLVRYDHRGHGASPVPAGPYRLDELGDDASELIDCFDGRRVSWVGLSLGGMVGMWLARFAPQRLDRLVLLCTSAKLGPPEGWAQRAELVRAKGTEAIADAAVGRWVTPGYAAANPERMTWLRDMIAATPAEGYASCCTAIELMDQLDELAGITAPTLVIGGARDPATPPADHQKPIAERIPGARLEVLSPGAHLVSYEQADRVSELIIDHLRRPGTENR
jgi:3-oxoadipate enol-lactonase